MTVESHREQLQITYDAPRMEHLTVIPLVFFLLLLLFRVWFSLLFPTAFSELYFFIYFFFTACSHSKQRQPITGCTDWEQTPRTDGDKGYLSAVDKTMNHSKADQTSSHACSLPFFMLQTVFCHLSVGFSLTTCTKVLTLCWRFPVNNSTAAVIIAINCSAAQKCW